MIYRIIKTHNYYTDEKFRPENMTAEKLIRFSADNSDYVIYQGSVIFESNAVSAESDALERFEREKENVLALNFDDGMNWDELTLEMESDDDRRIIAEYVKIGG